MTGGRNRLAANGGCFCGHAWAIHDRGGCIGCDCEQKAPPRRKPGSPLDAGGGGMLAIDTLGMTATIDPDAAQRARLTIAEAALRVEARDPATDAREFAIEIMANLGLLTTPSDGTDEPSETGPYGLCEECGAKYLRAVYDPAKPSANSVHPQRYCSARCRHRAEERRRYDRLRKG